MDVLVMKKESSPQLVLWCETLREQNVTALIQFTLRFAVQVGIQ